MKNCKEGKVRLTALFLAAVMLIGLLPVSSHAQMSGPLIITVQNSSGQALTDAIVIIRGSLGSRRAVNEGDGTYLYEKNAFNEGDLSIHAACDGYYAQIETISQDATELTVTLDTCDKTNHTWETFGVFYKVDGTLPDVYYEPGDSQSSYGPSGNGTALTTISIDLTRLQTLYADVAAYDNPGYSGSGWFATKNTYQYYPQGSGQSMADCLLFWEAVKECLDFESEQAFRSTGLYDVYIAYCIKEESSFWGSKTLHLDGVLDVEPPVYVIELSYNNSNISGFVSDQRVSENVEFPTLEDVLNAYEENLNQTIAWEQESTSSYTGTYVLNKLEYTVTVTQTNYSQASITPEGSEIGYAEEGEQYYLATFNMTRSDPVQVQFTVTYTDGLEYETVFTDQVQTANNGDSIDLFNGVEGSTEREGYIFQGWVLEGGDGTLLSDEDIAKMTVQGEDIVFVASYIPKPVEYTVTYDLNEGTGGPETLIQTYTQGSAVTVAQEVPTKTGFCFQGWDAGNGTTVQPGESLSESIGASYTLTARWEEAIAVTFYTNVPGVDESVFRTYYSAGAALPGSGSNYYLAADGSIEAYFYDIPEFKYHTHNKYIFKGWYLDEDNENDQHPIDWTTVYTQKTDIYAHWIYVGTVKQEDDGKQNIPDGEYSEYDLAGTQVRLDSVNSGEHYKDGELVQGGLSASYAGLRYISVISENVWSKVKGIRPENADEEGYDAEYGMVLARRSRAVSAAGDNSSYQLQYKGSNVNGLDTSEDYWYAVNFKCSGLKKDGADHDHFNGEAYRLYTLVVTYSSYTEEAKLAEALATPFIARSYIRYYDANGLYRTYYNNYAAESNVYYGCSASYDQVVELTGAVQ